MVLVLFVLFVFMFLLLVLSYFDRLTELGFDDSLLKGILITKKKNKIKLKIKKRESLEKKNL